MESTTPAMSSAQSLRFRGFAGNGWVRTERHTIGVTASWPDLRARPSGRAGARRFLNVVRIRAELDRCQI